MGEDAPKKIQISPAVPVCCDGSLLSRENASSPGEETQGNREAGQAGSTNNSIPQTIPKFGAPFSNRSTVL